MKFPDAVRSALTNYATFAGRARRSEFWFFYLFLLLAQIGASILDGAIFGWAASGPIGLVVSLGLLLPMIAVAARRLHDGGRSGWWMLIGLVPLVGWIIIIVWYCRRGEDGPNRFGADPRGAGGFGGGSGGGGFGAGPAAYGAAPPGGVNRPWPVNGPGSRPGGA